MHADYPDALDACAAAAENIRRDFPAAMFELTFHVRGQPHGQRHVGSSQEIAGILERCIAGFRGARVYYSPHHRYGLICLIECWCRRDGQEELCEDCRCGAVHNRSSIAIILCEHDGRSMLVGGPRTPADRHGEHDTPRPWRAEEGPRH